VGDPDREEIHHSELTARQEVERRRKNDAVGRLVRWIRVEGQLTRRDQRGLEPSRRRVLVLVGVDVAGDGEAKVCGRRTVQHDDLAASTEQADLLNLAESNIEGPMKTLRRRRERSVSLLG